MNFDFTEDQQTIKRTARELLAARSTPDRVRANAEAGTDDLDLYRELCELGWAGIAAPEEHGGQGLGVVELVVLLEELGYACAVTPFLGTVLASLAIDDAGSAEQKARWLAGLSTGEIRGALGIARDGVAELVPDAPGADVLVLVEDGTARVVERDGVDVEPQDAIDLTRRYGRVRVADGAGESLDGDVEGGLARARVALSAELVGVSQRALDMTLEFVKDRKQFGVPVGSFQAVSHRAAEMLLDVEGARSATYFAAWAAGAERDRLALGASLAKAAASDGARRTTAAAIQLHGGIGFTWEADVHWLYKRAQLGAALLGGAGEHRARIASLAAEAAAASRA